MFASPSKIPVPKKRPPTTPSTPRQQKRTKITNVDSPICTTRPRSETKFKFRTPEPPIRGTPRRVKLDHSYATDVHYVSCVECKNIYEFNFVCTDCKNTDNVDDDDDNGDVGEQNTSGECETCEMSINSQSSKSSSLLAEKLSVSEEYAPTTSNSSDDYPSNGTIPAQTHPADEFINDRKFIVFESQLLDALNICREPDCGKPRIEFRSFITGSMITYESICLDGHRLKWSSQPRLVRKEASRPAGNLLIPGAILTTGNTYKRIKDFSDALGLTIVSKTVYNQVQREYLEPAIQEAWDEQQKGLLAKCREKPSVKLCGDGRCDSPGHCAKYGLYSLMLMDETTPDLCDKIIETNLLDTAEPSVKNSNAMEPMGLSHGLFNLEEEEVNFELLATDQHSTVTSNMKKDYPIVDHEFDVWHLSKNLIKKLTKLSKKKGHEGLVPWIRHVSNHLWWCSATCDGDANILKEKWISLLNHVINKHSFKENVYYKKCAHKRLTKKDRKGMEWVKKDSLVFEDLKKIVLNPYLLNSLPQLTKFCHTGQLEVFHSMLGRYAPKRLAFSHSGMKARCLLAVIDWNTQDHTPIDPEKLKEQNINIDYAKRTSRFRIHVIAKPHVDISKPILKRVMVSAIDNVKLPPMRIPMLLRRTTKLEKPTKQEILSQHKSRFKKLSATSTTKTGSTAATAKEAAGDKESASTGARPKKLNTGATAKTLPKSTTGAKSTKITGAKAKIKTTADAKTTQITGAKSKVKTGAGAKITQSTGAKSTVKTAAGAKAAEGTGAKAKVKTTGAAKAAERTGAKAKTTGAKAAESIGVKAKRKTASGAIAGDEEECTGAKPKKPVPSSRAEMKGSKGAKAKKR